MWSSSLTHRSASSRLIVMVTVSKVCRFGYASANAGVDTIGGDTIGADTPGLTHLSLLLSSSAAASVSFTAALNIDES